MCSSRRSGSRECTQLLTSSVVIQNVGKASFEQVLNTLPDVADNARKFGNKLDWKSMELLTLLCFLRQNTNPQVDATNRHRYITHLVEYGYPELFLNWWQQLWQQKLFSRNGEPVLRNVRCLAGILWNCTEFHETFCEEFMNFDGVEIMLKCLASEQLAPKRLTTTGTDSTSVSRCLISQTCATVLLHTVKSCLAAKARFRHAQGLDVARRFMEPNSMDIIRGKSLLLLAYTTNDDEALNITGSIEILKYLLKLLTEAACQPNHVGKLYPFPATELIDGINRLAVNDSNKRRLVALGLLHTYAVLSAHAVDATELTLLLIGVWLCAFVPENRLAIAGDALLTQRLHQLVDDDDSKVRKCVQAIDFLLNDGHFSQHMMSRSRPTSIQYPDQDHQHLQRQDHNDHHIVYLSYQCNYRPLAALLEQKLVELGFRTCLLADTAGTSLDEQLGWIDAAAVVLVCASESYKNSPSCRLECEYLYSQRKPFQCVYLDDGYEPDGWLGLMLASHTGTAIDMGTNEKLHHNLPQLARCLHDLLPVHMSTAAGSGTRPPPPPVPQSYSKPDFEHEQPPYANLINQPASTSTASAAMTTSCPIHNSVVPTTSSCTSLLGTAIAEQPEPPDFQSQPSPAQSSPMSVEMTIEEMPLLLNRSARRISSGGGQDSIDQLCDDYEIQFSLQTIDEYKDMQFSQDLDYRDDEDEDRSSPSNGGSLLLQHHDVPPIVIRPSTPQPPQHPAEPAVASTCSNPPPETTTELPTSDSGIDSQPATANCQKAPDFSRWDRARVQLWLGEVGLADLSDILQNFDGQVLYALRQMYERAPSAYYVSVRQDLHVTDMLLLLRFTSELEKL